MSTSGPPDDDVDRCMTALEAVSDVALEHCNDAETIQQALGRLLGVEPDPDCDAALAEGLNAETCESTLGLRQWVMCRAHQLIDEDGVAFSAALDDAWAEARDSCGDLGFDV